MEWFKKAADQGLAAAQEQIGLMYAHGDGVNIDSPGALKWFRKAADQGDADAEYNLGVMYGNGKGVTPELRETQDYTEAIELYRKSHDDFINSLNNMLKKVDPAAKGLDPATFSERDVQADKGGAVAVPSEAVECLVFSGGTNFFH
jgi:TPR repeat protein